MVIIDYSIFKSKGLLCWNKLLYKRKFCFFLWFMNRGCRKSNGGNNNYLISIIVIIKLSKNENEFWMLIFRIIFKIR